MNSIEQSSTSALNLNQSLREHLNNDPDYQIIQRMMHKETVETSSFHVTKNSSASAPIVNDIQPQQQQKRIEQTLQVATARFQQQLETSRTLQLRVEARNEPIKQSDPLVLDLGGNGFQTTGLDNGVRFDIDGNGTTEQVSVPTGDDALLAIDRNNNGRIDSGKELFGDQNGAANGFAELARYDDNKDGKIDSSDRIYEQLRLIQLQNNQQSSQSLKDAGIKSLSLHNINQSQAINRYDSMAQLGEFEYLSGKTGSMADLLLANQR